MDHLEKSAGNSSGLAAGLIRGLLILGQDEAMAKDVGKTIATLQKAAKTIDKLNAQNGTPSRFREELTKIKNEKEKEMKRIEMYERLGLTSEEIKALENSEEIKENEDTSTLMKAAFKIEESPYLITERFGILDFSSSEEEYREANKNWFRMFDQSETASYLVSDPDDASVYYDLIIVGGKDAGEIGNCIPVPVFLELLDWKAEIQEEVVSLLQKYFHVEIGERKEVKFGRDNCHSKCLSCEFYSEDRERREDENYIHEYVNSYCSNEQWKNDPSTGESWCIPHKVVMPTPRYRGTAP